MVGGPLVFMNATTDGLFVPVMAVFVGVIIIAMSFAAIVFYMRKPSERDAARIAQQNAERDAPIIWNQLG